MSRKDLKHNIVVTSLFLAIATAIATIFFVTTQNTTNVTIIYALSAMMIARRTEGYVPGIVASFVSVIFTNFIFTYPFFELNFTLDGYPMTFMALMIITAMTSTLTTHLKAQTRILNEREHQLMEAEKEKMRANLLRAISHDLRTPLTGIIGTADSYLEHSNALSAAEKIHLIENISADANWLLQMVENLLSVTRIQDGGVGVVTTLEPLEEVIPDAVMRFRKRIPDAIVQVSIPEDFIMVPMDATLIEQVLINLLENAVYHGDGAKPIELTVTVAGSYARFSIRDQGNGIDESILPILFDGYTPIPNQCSDAHKGMGIGLSICKTIINAHHGDLYARNHDNGAEFIFTLPIGDEHHES